MLLYLLHALMAAAKQHSVICVFVDKLESFSVVISTQGNVEQAFEQANMRNCNNLHLVHHRLAATTALFITQRLALTDFYQDNLLRVCFPRGSPLPSA